MHMSKCRIAVARLAPSSPCLVRSRRVVCVSVALKNGSIVWHSVRATQSHSLIVVSRRFRRQLFGCAGIDLRWFAQLKSSIQCVSQMLRNHADHLDIPLELWDAQLDLEGAVLFHSRATLVQVG